MKLFPELPASRFPQRFLDDAAQSFPLSAGLLFQLPRKLCG
jgi:hypothetical protein